MSTKLWAIGIVLFSTLLTSTAQLFYKFASDKLSFDILSLITNFELIMGMVLYAIGGILLILSFRGGRSFCFISNICNKLHMGKLFVYLLSG